MSGTAITISGNSNASNLVLGSANASINSTDSVPADVAVTETTQLEDVNWALTFQGYPEIQLTSLTNVGLDLSGTSLADVTFKGKDLDMAGTHNSYAEINFISNYLSGGNVSWKDSSNVEAVPYVWSSIIANQVVGNKHVLVLESNPSWYTEHVNGYVPGVLQSLDKFLTVIILSENNTKLDWFNVLHNYVGNTEKLNTLFGFPVFASERLNIDTSDERITFAKFSKTNLYDKFVPTDVQDTAIANTIYYLENVLSMTVTKTTTATDLSATNTSYYLLKMVATEDGKLATNTEFTSAKDTSLVIVDVSGIPDGSYNHESYGNAFWSPGIMKAQYLLPYQNKPDTVAGFAWLLNTTLAEAANIGIKDPVVQAGYRSVEVRTIDQAIADNLVLYKLG